MIADFVIACQTLQMQAECHFVVIFSNKTILPLLLYVEALKACGLYATRYYDYDNVMEKQINVKTIRVLKANIDL